MAKLQDLRNFDTGARPATQRLSLARLSDHDGERFGDRDPSAPAAGLSPDLLAQWIRESAPPSAAGTEPVVLESTARRRPVEPEAPRSSGLRLRAAALSPHRPVRRALSLITCVALWSVLLLWVLGTLLRAPALLLPVRAAVVEVRVLHGQVVERLERVIGGVLE